MKVVFDGRVIADHYPGIGRYAYGLARALAERAGLTLLTNPQARNTRFDLEAVRARRVAVPAGPASLASQWLVPRALAGLAPGLYHSPCYLMPYNLAQRATPNPQYATSNPSGLVRVAGYGLRFTHYALRAPRLDTLPTVLTLYDLTPLLPGSGYGPLARLAYRWAHRLALASASRVIALSRWAKESFAAEFGLPAETITVIPPGLDPAFQPRPPAEIEAARARLRLPETYSLFVGSNRPHKNLARLLAAWASLPEGAPPLVVAGARGPTAPRVENIRFIGPVLESDLPALYSGARLFVCPSLSEGFGLPVLEAMACGAPAACSTAPGLDEAAGPAAARFDPHDPEAMAQALAALLDSPARLAEMRAAASAHAARFTWEQAAGATLEVYAQALRG